MKTNTHFKSRKLRTGCVAAAIAALTCCISGCSTTAEPIATVPQVDIPRFMGDWYVIACIPTRLEKTAYNALESYRLEKDGTIATTFSYRDGGFDGEQKRHEFRGFVVPDSGNAEWKMQLIWPFKAEYLIAYLDDDYSKTIIARNKRDYVWIMARQPQLSEAEYQELERFVADLGYATDALRKIPQRWPVESQP